MILDVRRARRCASASRPMSSDGSATSAACSATSEPGRAYRNADIGPRERGCVVDAIADEGDLAACSQFAHLAHLVLWQHASKDLVGFEAELRANAQRHRPAVSRHHDDPAHATAAQRDERR